MKCQILFSGKKYENIVINLSSAEFAQSVLNDITKKCLCTRTRALIFPPRFFSERTFSFETIRLIPNNIALDKAILFS